MNAVWKWASAAAFIAAVGCSKKDDDKESSTSSVPESITEPVGVLNLALDSMKSAMATDIAGSMLGATSLRLADETKFSEDDCTEHGEAKARVSDDAQYKDNSGRLRASHPRAALQSLYCQMQKDTGAPDSFLGAVSQNKMLFCIMGSALKFDGVEHEVAISRAGFEACLGDASEEDKAEMMDGVPEEGLTGKITASAPAAFGAAGQWDGSIHFFVPWGDDTGVTLDILLRDSNDVVAVAVNNGAGRTLNIDAYVAAINKATGEVRFESKFQRIRTPDGTSSNGWNRHARAYLKGEMDENLIFTSVSAVQGLYSDISNNVPGGDNSGAKNADDPIQYGTAWTVKGSDDAGFKSHAYNLSCSGSGEGQAYTCQDVNLAASWAATEGSGACNGALSGQTCAGDGIEVSENSQTAFFMDLNHDDFETTEDWFKNLKVPAFSDLELVITQ